MNDVGKPSPALLTVCALVTGALACGNLTPGGTQSDESGGPGGTGNDETMGSASATDTTPTGGGVETVTIYDLQQGKVAVDSLVTIKDVVVTGGVYTTSMGKYANFFLSEKDGGEYSGIQVFLYADTLGLLEADGKLPKVGDVVDITAVYQEFAAMGDPEEYSELRLDNSIDLTITGAGPVPAPSVVDAADVANGGAKTENYEGCLIQINGAKVSAEADMYGTFTLEGGLKVDDVYFSSPKPAVGTTFDLVGALNYSFGDWKLFPRTCADFQGWADCTMMPDPTDTNPDCMPGGDVTIFQLQQDEICLQEAVTVTGAVVTSGLTFKQDGFFIEDPAGGEYSGVFVYIGNMNPLGIDVQPGDVVTVSGAFDEFFGASQIEVTAADGVMVTGTAAIPDPAVVAPADVATGGPKAEAYEGVLVRVEGVTVVDNTLDFGEWTVDDDLRVDDLFFAMADWVVPAPGTVYDAIVGPLAFTYDDTKIAPRTTDDLQPAP